MSNCLGLQFLDAEIAKSIRSESNHITGAKVSLKSRPEIRENPFAKCLYVFLLPHGILFLFCKPIYR